MICPAKFVPVLLLINSIRAQNNPSLRVLDENYQPISYLYAEEGTTVYLECSRGWSNSVKLEILTLQENNSETVHAFCYNYQNRPNASSANVECIGTNKVRAPLLLSITPPATYQCRETVLSESSYPLSNQITGLKTYKTPETPQILKNDSSPMEGEPIEFSCWSNGRPRPKLRFRFMPPSSIPITNVRHDPPISTITNDSPQGNSSITWDVIPNGEMNDKTLRCEVYDHISVTDKYDDELLWITYGPADTSGPKLMSVNLETVDTIEIPCDLSSNPAPEVTWYNSTLDDENRIKDKSPLILDKANYNYITKDMNVQMNLICKAVNPQTKKMATQQIEVTFQRYVPTTTIASTIAATKSAAADEGGTEATPSWVWILVALGITCVIVVVIIVVIFVRRRATSSPEKRKKKVLRESDRSATSPASPHVPSDVIRQPSQDQPSTLDYRKSQNVEDYAGAISMQPRSRKPIAFNEGYDDLESNPSNVESGGPPAYNSVTDSPAGDYQREPSYQPDPYQLDHSYNTGTYNSADPYQYNTYQRQQMQSPNGSYNMGYGAPC